MNSSLRDQLLKAGLVSEKQVHQAVQEEQRRHRREQSSGRTGRNPQAQPARQPQAAQQAQAAKTARDLELNRRREEKAQRKARIAELQQLIEQNRLPAIESDERYSFVDGKKIRRVPVDAQRRRQLVSGELAIVRYKGHYAVVPAGIATRIGERDAHQVIAHDQPPPADTVDEAYKDFVVPDDLTW